jgi:hypothetical protein
MNKRKQNFDGRKDLGRRIQNDLEVFLPLCSALETDLKRAVREKNKNFYLHIMENACSLIEMIEQSIRREGFEFTHTESLDNYEVICSQCLYFTKALLERLVYKVYSETMDLASTEVVQATLLVARDRLETTHTSLSRVLTDRVKN